jgi:hypothetical protein
MSSGQMSFWANVLLGKRPSGQMSSGQMSFWANVFLGKRLLGKHLMGKCASGQMSFWANIFWADVFWANVVLGKCLWANVVRMGKCRVTLNIDFEVYALNNRGAKTKEFSLIICW